MKKRVLFLGATGRIGPSLIEELKENYSKNLYDIIIGVHKPKKIQDFKTVKIDLDNINILKKAMKGIDVVINLAAESDPKAPFEDIIKPNLIGAYNVFEAARRAKVKRVIFASSVHAVKGYPLNTKIKNYFVPKPINIYGASKVFGEALCYVFSSKYNISCLAIRIGAYVSDDRKKTICLTRENFDYTISQRDMAQLIHKCIIAPKSVKHGILAGSSKSKHNYMDLPSTKKLVGYKPKDDAFEMCKYVGRNGE